MQRHLENLDLVTHYVHESRNSKAQRRWDPRHQSMVVQRVQTISEDLAAHLPSSPCNNLSEGCPYLEVRDVLQANSNRFRNLLSFILHPSRRMPEKVVGIDSNSSACPTPTGMKAHFALVRAKHKLELVLQCEGWFRFRAYLRHGLLLLSWLPERVTSNDWRTRDVFVTCYEMVPFSVDVRYAALPAFCCTSPSVQGVLTCRS